MLGFTTLPSIINIRCEKSKRPVPRGGNKNNCRNIKFVQIYIFLSVPADVCRVGLWAFELSTDIVLKTGIITNTLYFWSYEK